MTKEKQTMHEATFAMHENDGEKFTDAPLRRHAPEVVTKSDIDRMSQQFIPGQLRSYLKESGIVKVKKLTETAKLPVYAEPGAACADLFADESLTIMPGAWVAVSTGLAFEIPHSFEVQIRARSGLALKHGLAILNGVGTIDSTYRGTIKAVLINQGSEPFRVWQGDRIAQMKVSKAEQWQFEEVEQLSETERGTGGFGSTGV